MGISVVVLDQVIIAAPPPPALLTHQLLSPVTRHLRLREHNVAEDTALHALHEVVVVHENLCGHQTIIETILQGRCSCESRRSDSSVLLGDESQGGEDALQVRVKIPGGAVEELEHGRHVLELEVWQDQDRIMIRSVGGEQEILDIG